MKCSNCGDCCSVYSKVDLHITDVFGIAEYPIIAPDIERMVDSRIFYMIKEAYLAISGGRFDERTARPFYESGVACMKNKAMREIVHRQILNEMKKLAPVDEKSGQQLLTGDEVAEIYCGLR